MTPGRPPGRPPGWLVLKTDLLLEAMVVGKKGRCTVPPRVRSGFAWFQPGAEILVVLTPRGRLRLKAWELVPAVQARLESIVTRLGETESAEDELVLLQDRYQRLRVDTATNRLELPDHITAHLDVLHGGVIFAVRFLNHIELWSKRFREERLTEAELLSDELP